MPAHGRGQRDAGKGESPYDPRPGRARQGKHGHRNPGGPAVMSKDAPGDRAKWTGSPPRGGAGWVAIDETVGCILTWPLRCAVAQGMRDACLGRGEMSGSPSEGVRSSGVSVPDRLTRFPWRACLAVFCLAFAVRAFLLTKIPTNTSSARSLRDHGDRHVALRARHVRRPLRHPTGPTAHAPPLYPAWLSLLYRVLGISMRTGYIQWLFDIAFDSAMFAMLPWLAFASGWVAGGAGGRSCRRVASTMVYGASRLSPPLLWALLLAVFVRGGNKKGPRSGGRSCWGSPRA